MKDKQIDIKYKKIYNIISSKKGNIMVSLHNNYLEEKYETYKIFTEIRV